MGKEYAQNIQYKSPNAKLNAVCSLAKDELEYAKGQLGIELCFSSFEEMVEKSNLDAVAILTPTKYHAQQIIFSLKNGLHVFSEKPLAISLEDCLKAEKEANKHPDLISCVGFVRRYDESYMDAKEAIEKNKIGDPFLFVLKPLIRTLGLHFKLTMLNLEAVFFMTLMFMMQIWPDGLSVAKLKKFGRWEELTDLKSLVI